MRVALKGLLRPRALLALLFAALVALIVVLANTGYRSSLFGFVDVLPYGDKLGHIGLMGTLSLVVTASLYPRSFRLGRVGVPLGSLLVLLVITLEECSQLWFPARTFSLGDLACNVVGIVGGALLATLCMRRVQRQGATASISASRG
jgi:polysaccharide biosynthesis protein VpsQ